MTESQAQDTELSNRSMFRRYLAAQLKATEAEKLFLARLHSAETADEYQVAHQHTPDMRAVGIEFEQAVDAWLASDEPKTWQVLVNEHLPLAQVEAAHADGAIALGRRLVDPARYVNGLDWIVLTVYLVECPDIAKVVKVPRSFLVRP